MQSAKSKIGAIAKVVAEGGLAVGMAVVENREADEVAQAETGEVMGDAVVIKISKHVALNPVRH